MWSKVIYLALHCICALGQFSPIPQIPCDRATRIINDCNWCYCDQNGRFVCGTRHCDLVDRNGHFNDAIQSIDVGMEEHGAWRSDITPCEPNVHYKRQDLLCICTEDGDWPNPVCRDVFRIMYPIEPPNTNLKDKNSCKPNKLILVGCNACYCPYTGIINPELCTKEKCSVNDPLINGEQQAIARIESIKRDASEIYSKCETHIKYKIGCRNCDCLSNNRLVCGECNLNTKVPYNAEEDTLNVNIVPIEIKNGAVCPKGRSYRIDCNYCFCLANGNALCTSRQCS